VNIKKYITLLFLVFTALITQGQNITRLKSFKKGDKIADGQAVILGTFIQRLGFSSGGFPQDIRLINIDTDEIYAFRVKATFKSSKTDNFIFHIKPGNYAILNYFWTQSKWYGGKMFMEPIFKGFDASKDFNKNVATREINVDDLQRYTFKIDENSINYLGEWNFNTGLVSFIDSKEHINEDFYKKFKNLDLSEAKLNLPK
jgi:hypothetical protein